MVSKYVVSKYLFIYRQSPIFIIEAVLFKYNAMCKYDFQFFSIKTTSNKNRFMYEKYWYDGQPQTASNHDDIIAITPPSY